jgi:hypothetical protein
MAIKGEAGFLLREQQGRDGTKRRRVEKEITEKRKKAPLREREKRKLHQITRVP